MDDKRKKYFLIVIFASTILISSIFVFLNWAENDKNLDKKISQVCFGNNCFEAEIADKEDTRLRGLMFRERLDEDKGMLFVYESEDIYSFWMLNTLIPLDIIWLDKNKKVVFIKKDARPCGEEKDCLGINPQRPALYVLEINAGLSDKIGLSVGDRIEIIAR